MLDAEKGLEVYRTSAEISFRDYLYYTKVELFSLLNETDKENANADLNKIDEVCWFVCAKNYLVRSLKLLNDDCVYQLWRIFNLHAETDLSDELLYPVVVDGEEVAFILQRLLLACGKTIEPGYVESIVNRDQQYR